jgi:hypothetical protein
MLSFSIIALKAAGVGRNVGGAIGEADSFGRQIDSLRDVSGLVPSAAYVDHAHVGIAGVGGNPLRFYELFGVDVACREGHREENSGQHGESLAARGGHSQIELYGWTEGRTSWVAYRFS